MSIDSFAIAGYQIHVNASIRPIQFYLNHLDPAAAPRICVDIGAADGLAYSNTLFLYMHAWNGLSLEADLQAFARLADFYGQYLPWVGLQQARVTPGNIGDILAASGIPAHFGFLSLDIDSFDYDVLEAVLGRFRPTLICAEINEKVPPPIRFWVPWRADHVYKGDHFYGMSLSALADLADRHGYDLLQLCFNNAFLIAREHNLWPVQSVAQAYAEGYLAGQIPDYNLNMAPLQALAPEAGVEFLQSHFADYAGRYECFVASAASNE